MEPTASSCVRETPVVCLPLHPLKSCVSCIPKSEPLLKNYYNEEHYIQYYIHYYNEFVKTF